MAAGISMVVAPVEPVRAEPNAEGGPVAVAMTVAVPAAVPVAVPVPVAVGRPVGLVRLVGLVVPAVGPVASAVGPVAVGPVVGRAVGGPVRLPLLHLGVGDAGEDDGLKEEPGRG